mmetsp:Transcript_4434/g.11112  ORF Transcript_4434/g.11112 Transcript_4434/m.11112 type:complete len:109 (-) Transcript_4434:995-1321(-)
MQQCWKFPYAAKCSDPLHNRQGRITALSRFEQLSEAPWLPQVREELSDHDDLIFLMTLRVFQHLIELAGQDSKKFRELLPQCLSTAFLSLHKLQNTPACEFRHLIVWK